MSFLRFFGGGAGAQATLSGHHSAGANHASGIAEKAEEHDRLLPPNPDSKQFGMENFGNTCYANSVLQALYFCQPFRDLVCMTPDPFREEFPHPAPPPATPATSKPPPSTPSAPSEAAQQPQATTPSLPPPPTLFSALRSLYLHISTHPSVRGVVSPTSFITKLKKENELFRGPMHQDAHEFLNFLLNKIVEDLRAEQYAHPLDLSDRVPEGSDIDHLTSSVGSLTPPSTTPNGRSERSGSPPYHNGLSSNPTLVQTLFEGVLTNETRCLTCETVSSRDESFLDLSIDIEQNSSVTACLRQFSASEMLCQKNKFFCDSCCSLQEAEKRMKIKILPNVLALHLKRFKLLPAEDKYVKLAYRVAFPLELRLFNTVDDAEDPDRLYRLFAIVVHIGGGPHHGHYITIVKSFGSVWRIFDDVNVFTIQESDIPKYFGDSSAGAGYVLFYQAADLVPETVGLPSKSVFADRTNSTSSPAKSQPAKLPVDSTAAPSSPPQMTRGIGNAADANGHGLPALTVSLVPALVPLPTPTVGNGSPNHPHLPSPNISKSPIAGGRTSPQPPESGAGGGRNHQATATPSLAPPLSPPGSGSSTAVGTSTPTSASSSSFTSTLFGRKVRPPSGVFSHRSPTTPSQHQQALGDGSQDTLNPAHVASSNNEKENKGGGSWFSRPRRKDSLHSPIPIPNHSSSPHSDASASNSSLPEIKPRSSRRPQMTDTIITSGMSTAGAAAADELRRSPVESTSPHLQRPRTAPGAGGPSPPSSPSTRTSFDKSYHGGEQATPPVPPLPDMSTMSLASSTLTPPSSTSSSSHHRRKSLTKHAGHFFSRPRSGHNDTLAVPILPPSKSAPGLQPPSPIVQPGPPPRHPRRVASVLPISSPPPPPATTPSRSRPPSSAELIPPSRPESMVATSPSIPSPIPDYPTSSTIQQNSTHTLLPSTASLQATPPTNNNSSPGIKRASRKMSFSGAGGLWGGWVIRDRDKDKDKDHIHQSNGRDNEKLYQDNPHAHPPSTSPQPRPKATSGAVAVNDFTAPF